MATSRIDPRLAGMRAVLERFISNVPSGDGHDAWRSLLAEATTLTERAGALHDLRATRDPTITDAAHTKRVLLAAAKYAKDVEGAQERMTKSWFAGLDTINARIRAKVKLNPDAYAAEVRDLYRRSSSTERTKLLAELVAENRGPELAAIVKAPRSLTGMSEEQRSNYEASFISHHAPDELRAREALEEAFNTSQVIHREARGLATAYSDPAKLDEITKAEARATEALRAFDAKASA